MKVQISFVSTKEIKEKIEATAKINKQNSSDVIRAALDLYFQKQDEKEMLNAILQRLDAIKRTSEDSDINSARVSIFMNHYVENDVSAEDYKVIRQKVLAELNGYVTKKGYVK